MDFDPYSDRIYDGLEFNIIVDTCISALLHLSKIRSYYSPPQQGAEAENTTPIQHGRSAEAFNQSIKNISRTYILLEIQSTVNIFSKINPLTNIHSADHIMVIRCIYGIVDITQVVELKYFGAGWYNP